jgi:hypothetical protein
VAVSMIKRTIIFAATFLVGVILIFMASNYISHESVWHELTRDLGIALAIAATIGSIIEWTLARDIALHGIKAAVGEFVDEAVWDEISNHIITQPVIRSKFHISVDVSKQGDRYVCDTTLSYQLKRMVFVRDSVVNHYLDDHRTGNDAAGKPLPRFTGAMIGGTQYTEDQIDKLPNSKAHRFTAPASFGPFQDEIPVSISLKEIIRSPDTYVWTMTLTSHEVEFEVKNAADIEFTVVALHPNPDQLSHTGNMWSFPGVMLVGQSLEIHTRPASPVGKSGAVKSALASSADDARPSDDVRSR